MVWKQSQFPWGDYSAASRLTYMSQRLDRTLQIKPKEVISLTTFPVEGAKFSGANEAEVAPNGRVSN